MSKRHKALIWKVKRLLEQCYSLTSLVEHLSPTPKLSLVFGLISGFRHLGSSHHGTRPPSNHFVRRTSQRSWLNSHLGAAFHRSILLNLLKDQDCYSCTATYLYY